jgi:hypothetical protein
MPKQYPRELQEPVIRLVIEHKPSHPADQRKSAAMTRMGPSGSVDPPTRRDTRTTRHGQTLKRVAGRVLSPTTSISRSIGVNRGRPVKLAAVSE